MANTVGELSCQQLATSAQVARLASGKGVLDEDAIWASEGGGHGTLTELGPTALFQNGVVLVATRAAFERVESLGLADREALRAFVQTSRITRLTTVDAWRNQRRAADRAALSLEEPRP